MVEMFEGSYPIFAITRHIENESTETSATDELECADWDEVVAEAQARREQQLANPLPGPRPELNSNGATRPKDIWGLDGQPEEATERKLWVVYNPAK